MKTPLFLFLGALSLLSPAFLMAETPSVSVERLLVENLKEPAVVEREHPRLSWNITSSLRSVRQEAYRIIVSSSEEKALALEGDVWDSGRVSSKESILVPYAGERIPQNTRVWWRVKSFTNKGESSWSEVSSWATGLYSFKAWNARWIGLETPEKWENPSSGSLAARYFRREFKLEGKPVRRATAFICGLGWYELYINGERIGEQVLSPAPTDFRKKQQYNAFDVTNCLFEGGENAVGVVLGNSCYFAMRQAKPYKNNNFGYPKLLFTLIVEYEDGSLGQVSSDGNWKLTARGPVTSNNEYDGETYDARLEMPGWNKVGFDDSAWKPAERTQIPSGELCGMMQPFIKVKKVLSPKSFNRLPDGRYIIDMGQNMTGWVTFKVKGERGDTVTLRFAETLSPDGELSMANLRSAKVTDTYILSGREEGEQWHPTFTYHGFRYVEVSGWKGDFSLENFRGEVVFDDMDTIGQFETDNATLNQIISNVWWGFASNYKGMPLDCPQRDERQPWLGDRIQSTWSEAYLFDNESIYDKWTKDIAEAARYDGSIPDVAPAFWNYYSDNMTWPSALPFTCEMLYRMWGNIEPMQRSYPVVKKWLTYMREQYMGKDYIISKDSYGDWCMPPETPEVIHSSDPLRITDPGLIASAFYCEMLRVMSGFASLTGNEQDIEEFMSLREKIKDALNTKYFNSEKGLYDNNTMTANILPLQFGLVPEGRERDVFESLVRKIESNGCKTDCGVLGTQWQLSLLTRFGRPDLAFAIASAKDYPSWGYMVSKGATTVWELYNGDTADPAMNSGNHVMLVGDLGSWCFKSLAGISPAAPAFREISLAPEFGIGALSKVNASYRSVSGTICSSWERSRKGEVKWSVDIPAGTKARLVIPAKGASFVRESGEKLSDTEDIRIGSESKEGEVVLEAGSGHYEFSFKLYGELLRPQ